MSSLLDFASLILTAAAFAGTVYGILYVTRLFSEGVKTTKEALKEKGLHISEKGVHVKTNKRFDRDDYVDATQRGFIKAMGASSFGRTPSGSGSSPSSGTPTGVSASASAPAMHRSQSSHSVASTVSGSEEKRGKRGLLKRAFSGSKDK